jgi:type VI secretion system ImpJ/VasE family protein
MHIHWHEGLFLEAHHLQWMQRCIQCDIRAVRSVLNPFAYGVIESDLSSDALAGGRILFNRLRVIMPRGEEVSFPEDAELPELDVRPALSRQGGAQEIFLVVPLWAAHRPNAFDIGQSADPKVKRMYIPREKREVADENTGEDRQTIHVRKINARLALKGESFEDTDTLPLLRVLRPAGDAIQARLDPEFVPACVLLKSSAVLYNVVRDLTAHVTAARDALQLKLAAGGFALEEKWTRTMKLTALNRVCGALPILVEDGAVPPLQIYLELRKLLGELAALIEGQDLSQCLNYDHTDPLPAFKDLDQKIRRAIVEERGKQPIEVVFTMVRPGFWRAELEPNHFEEPNGYLLGVKTNVDITKLAPYVTDGNKFKLMPTSMQSAALFGLELQRVPVPPIELPGGAHYFRLAPSSNSRRWEQIKNDKSISLIWNNREFDLTGATFSLWMTLP